MGIKEEFKHSMKNVLHDVDLAVRKTWEVLYEGHMIRLENSMNKEQLYIDDKLVDEVRHEGLLSHLKPYSKLIGIIERENGDKEKVTVKIGGFVKLSIHMKVGNKTVLKEKVSVEILPWEQKEAIVSFIEAQVEEHGTVIETTLPDIEYIYDQELALNPGYADQIGQESPLPLFEKGLVKQIKKLIEKPTIKRRRIIYEKVNDEYMSTYGAKLLHHLQEEAIDLTRLEEEALWFLNNAAHREVLKFALVLLSMTNVEPHRERLLTIAKHEEFTMFALLGISKLEQDAHALAWKLADQLNGWGKVVLMHYLEAITPEEKIWFLKQTFTDKEMKRAVALVIAERAELDVLLSETEIEKDTFLQINSVIDSLLYKDSAGNREMDEYNFAPLVLKQFIEGSEQYAEHKDIQATIDAIRKYVNEADDEWAIRYERNWEIHERERLCSLLK